MYILYYVGREPVSRERHEDLGGAFPPWHVMWGAPARDGTEEKREVVLPGQLLGRRYMAAQAHQQLQNKTQIHDI